MSMSTKLSWSGGAKVADLLDSGLLLNEIVDVHGCAVHVHASEFCAHHPFEKRLIIKNAISDNAVRQVLRNNDVSMVKPLKN